MGPRPSPRALLEFGAPIPTHGPRDLGFGSALSRVPLSGPGLPAPGRCAGALQLLGAQAGASVLHGGRCSPCAAETSVRRREGVWGPAKLCPKQWPAGQPWAPLNLHQISARPEQLPRVLGLTPCPRSTPHLPG